LHIICPQRRLSIIGAGERLCIITQNLSNSYLHKEGLHVIGINKIFKDYKGLHVIGINKIFKDYNDLSYYFFIELINHVD